MTRRHCCETMQSHVDHTCPDHAAGDCPDQLVRYPPKFDEYGIAIRDGGSAVSRIAYCPWCRTQLPASRRDAWFDALEALGLGPDDPDIPAEFETAAWYA